MNIIARILKIFLKDSNNYLPLKELRIGFKSLSLRREGDDSVSMLRHVGYV